MRNVDALTTASAGLRHAKTRSILTMLGIVIGISSVIILMSVGRSAQDFILNQVKSVGSNLVFIIPGGTNGSTFSAPASAQGIVIKSLVARDIDAIKREPSVLRATGEVRGSSRAVYQDTDIGVTYEGASADLFPMRDFKTQKGYPFAKADVDSFGHVVVIGSKLADTLFGAQEPIGKIIRVKDVSFRVVGVLEEKGVGPFGVDQDQLVIMPITVAQKQLVGISYFHSLTIEADPTYDVNFVKERLVSVLRQNHGVTDPLKDDFTIRTQEDAVALLGTITSVLTLFLTAIAAISLVVGGIGIMNIMLVSVVERTKEIGLRKAVGATDWDIQKQFLFESVMLTTIGGVIGILFGALITTLIYFGVSHFSGIAWTFAFPLSAVLIALLVSTATGIVFGIYPARQAAKKSPIEALRYE